jgi:hypothetical protein
VPPFCENSNADLGSGLLGLLPSRHLLHELLPQDVDVVRHGQPQPVPATQLYFSSQLAYYDFSSRLFSPRFFAVFRIRVRGSGTLGTDPESTLSFSGFQDNQKI